MNKKQIVLFDVGGVLLELNYSGMYEAGAKASGKTPHQFKQDYIQSGIEPKRLSGKINPEAYLAEFRKILNLPDASELELFQISANAWKNQISETVELKRRIYESRGLVGLFSNADEGGLRIISSKFPEILETFGGPKVYSYQVGDVKPNSPMYEEIQKMGFDNIIYIDDNLSYVRKGLEFGWNGILFTPYLDSAEAVRAEKGHNKVAQPNKNIKIADSILELEQALKELGVSLK